MSGRLWTPTSPRIWTPPPPVPRRRHGPEWGDQPYSWPLPSYQFATRTAVSALGTTTASTLVMTWTGTQPTAGNKLFVGFWVSAASPADPLTVKDNGVSIGTFTKSAATAMVNAQGAWIYHLDAVVLPAAGNYAVTATWTTAPTDADGIGASYSGVSSGAPAATNTNTGANSGPASPGAVNPSGTCTYFGVCVQDTGANPGTVSVASPFANLGKQTNGNSQQVGSADDDLNGSGSQNPSWTLDGSAAHWGAVVAVWTNTASAAPVLPIVEHQQAVNRASLY